MPDLSLSLHIWPGTEVPGPLDGQVESSKLSAGLGKPGLQPMVWQAAGQENVTNRALFLGNERLSLNRNRR